MDQFIDSSSEEECPQKAEPPKEPEKKNDEKQNSAIKMRNTKEAEVKENLKASQGSQKVLS